MSISVTVSGEDSTSIILTQPQTGLISISGDRFIDVTAFSGDSATVIVSSGDPITITGNYSNYATGDVVRPPEISDFLTENQINSKIITATGDYNTLATNSFYPKSNPSGYITGVDLSDYVEKSETGAFYASSNPSGYITGVDLSAYTTEEFVTGVSGYLQGQISSNDSEITEIVNSTGSFALKSETGSFISESQTGQFYAASNPSGYITGVDLSSYVQDSETGAFYASSNPSGFITGVDLSSYVQNSETGLFLVSGEDAVVNTIGVGGSPDNNIDIHVKSNSAKFLVENTLGGGEWVRFSAGTVGSSMKFSNTAGFSIGPVASKTDTSLVDDFYMASNGNIGIGTSSPSGKLHIVGSAQNSYIEPIVENTASPSAAGFAFKNSNKEWKIGVNTSDTFRVRDHTAGANVFQIESSAPGDSLVIDSNGKTTTKQIEATSSSYPVLGFTRETATAGGSFDSANGIASAMKLITKTSANMTDGFGGGIVFALSDNTFDSNANARIYARRDGSDNNAALQFFNKGADGAESSMIIRSNGNVGIGTTSPTEKLEVSGNLMIQENGVIKNKNNNTQFKFGVNDLYLDSGHLRAGYSVGIRGNRGSTKGMEQGSTRNSDLGLYCASIEAVSIRNNGNVDANYNFTINQDLSVSGDSSFSSRPTVNGTGVLLIGEGGGGTVENAVYTTGDQTISGTKSFGKISLSENSFVTETGSFTMSSTHRGATVLLQNSAPMTVTIPAQVSGHTTTFIAETSNSVVFATGAGISGFNSFNSANQIAGIYGQAQIIFKSPEYAFLGGNVV